MEERTTDSGNYCKLFGGDFNLLPGDWAEIDLPNGYMMVPVLGSTMDRLALTSLIQFKNYKRGEYGSNPFDTVLYKLSDPAASRVPENPIQRNNYGVFDIVYTAPADLQLEMVRICNDYKLYKDVAGVDSCEPEIPMTSKFLTARFMSDHLPIYIDVGLGNTPLLPSPPPLPPAGRGCKRKRSDASKEFSRLDVPDCRRFPYRLAKA